MTTVHKLRDTLRKSKLGQGPAGSYSKKPKYTLQECADRLGSTQRCLIGLMGHTDDNPKPVMRLARTFGGPINYYDFDEVKAWWNRHHAVTTA